MTVDEAVAALRAHGESLFPKTCSCGRTYATLADYIRETTPVGSAHSYDAEARDWKAADPLGAFAMANCSCGSTLSLTTHGMPLETHHALLDWIKTEVERRNVAPRVVAEELRNLVRDGIGSAAVDGKRRMLQHFLAALAYRTQKAVRGAPSFFGEFTAGSDVRCPRELVRHMTGVLGYARTFFIGGTFRAEPLSDLPKELARFHEMLADISAHLERGTPLRDTTPERLLQGPFADAMTHAGQLAMLRRLSGSPVAPENFIVADIHHARLGQEQSPPVSPDAEWPEASPGWRPGS